MKWLLALSGTLPSCSEPPSKSGECGPSEVCIIAGTGDLGFNGDNQSARQTRLASPSAVYESPDGDVTIVDYSNMRIRTVDGAGIIQTTVGNGFHAYSEPGADPIDTPLENPIDMGWSPAGELCLLPQHEGRVICINGDNQIERHAGTGVIADSGDGGDALDADLGYGGGMVFAEDGTLFISDSSFSRVRRVTPDGTIDTVLGTGSAGTGEAGFGPDMPIRFPERLAFDEELKRLFVADTWNHRVIELDAETLEAQILAGTGEGGFSGDSGPAAEAQFNFPAGVAVGPNGSVLIADSRNHRIRLVDSSGSIDTIAGTGAAEISREPADPLDFALVGPSGMAWTSTGDLLIAEQFGHRILRVNGLWNDLQGQP